MTLHVLRRIALLAGPLAIVAVPDIAHAVCTNLSLSDCNPAGTTLNAASAFVDPSPPVGYDQCAGFINTAADDVDPFWENNCIEFNTGDLWLRVYDDTTGELIAGAHMIEPIACVWAYPSMLGYNTDTQEGEGLLGHVGTCDGSSSTTLPWFADPNFLLRLRWPDLQRHLHREQLQHERVLRRR